MPTAKGGWLRTATQKERKKKVETKIETTQHPQVY
jgi:hypothetical protein